MASKSSSGSAYTLYSFNELVSREPKNTYGVPVPQGREVAQEYPRGPLGYEGFQGALLLQPFEPRDRLQEFRGVQRLQDSQGPERFIGNELRDGHQSLQGYQGGHGSQVLQVPTLQGPESFIGNRPHQGLQSLQEFQVAQGFQGSQGLVELHSFQGLEIRQGLPGSSVPGPHHTGSLFCKDCFVTNSFCNSSNTICGGCGSKLPNIQDFMSDEAPKIRGDDTRRGFDTMNNSEPLHWVPSLLRYPSIVSHPRGSSGPAPQPCLGEPDWVQPWNIGLENRGDSMFFSKPPSLDDGLSPNVFGAAFAGQILRPSLSTNIAPDSLETLATTQVKTEPPFNDCPRQPVGWLAMSHPQKHPLSSEPSQIFLGNSPTIQCSVPRHQKPLEMDSCNLCGEGLPDADARDRHKEICQGKLSSLSAVAYRKSVESSSVDHHLVQGNGEILPQPPVSNGESTSNRIEKCRLCAKQFHGRNAAQRRINHEKRVCKLRSYTSVGSSQESFGDLSAAQQSFRVSKENIPLSSKPSTCRYCGKIFEGIHPRRSRRLHEDELCKIRSPPSPGISQGLPEHSSAGASTPQTLGNLPPLPRLSGDEPGKIARCKFCGRSFTGKSAVSNRSRHEKARCPVKLGLSAGFHQYALDRTSVIETSTQVCGESLPQLVIPGGEPLEVDYFCGYCGENFGGPWSVWRRNEHERAECQKRPGSFSAGRPLEIVAGSSTIQHHSSITMNNGTDPDQKQFTTLADQLAIEGVPMQPTQLDSDVHEQIDPSVSQADGSPFDTQSTSMQIVEESFFDAAFDPTADLETETPGATIQLDPIPNSFPLARSNPALQTVDTNTLLQQMWDIENVDNLCLGGLETGAPLLEGIAMQFPASISSSSRLQAMPQDFSQMGLVGCSPSEQRNMSQEPQMTQSWSSPSNETWMLAQERLIRTPPPGQPTTFQCLAQGVEVESSPPNIEFSWHGLPQLLQSAEMQDEQSQARLHTTTQPNEPKSSRPGIAGLCDYQLHQQQMQQMRANSQAEFMLRDESAYESPLTQQSRHLPSNTKSWYTQPQYTQGSQEQLQSNYPQDTQSQDTPEGWEQLQDFVFENAESWSLQQQQQQQRQQPELQSLVAHIVKRTGAGVIEQGFPSSYSELTDETSVPAGCMMLTGDAIWEQDYGAQSTSENHNHIGLRGEPLKLGRGKVRLRGGYGEIPSTPVKAMKQNSPLRSQSTESQLRQERHRSPTDAKKLAQMDANNGELVPRSLPSVRSTGPQITKRVQLQRSNINRLAKEVMLTDGNFTRSKPPPRRRRQGLRRETSSVRSRSRKPQNSLQVARDDTKEKTRVEVILQRTLQCGFSSRLRGGQHPLPKESASVQQYPPSSLGMDPWPMHADWGRGAEKPQQPGQSQQCQPLGHQYSHSVQPSFAGAPGSDSYIMNRTVDFMTGQPKTPQYVQQYPAPHRGHGLRSLPAQKENRMPVSQDYLPHYRRESLNTQTVHQNLSQLPQRDSSASDGFSFPHGRQDRITSNPSNSHPSHIHPLHPQHPHHLPRATRTLTLSEAVTQSNQTHQQRPQPHPQPTAPVQQRNSSPVPPSWRSQNPHHPSLQDQQNRWQIEHLRSHHTPLNPHATRPLIRQPPQTPKSITAAASLAKDRRSIHAIQQAHPLRREKKWIWRWKKVGWRTVRIDDAPPRTGTPLRTVRCASLSLSPSPEAGGEAEAEAEDPHTCWECESAQAGPSEGSVEEFLRRGEGDADWGGEREIDGGQDEDGYEEDEREGETWRGRVEMWRRGVVPGPYERFAGEGSGEGSGEEAGGTGRSQTYFERLAEEGGFEDEAGGFSADALWDGGIGD